MLKLLCKMFTVRFSVVSVIILLLLLLFLEGWGGGGGGGGVRGRGSKNTPVKNHKFKRADVHP